MSNIVFPKPRPTRADRRRLRHTRRLALDALKEFGVRFVRLRLLHDGQNTTYRIDTRAGPRALRITRLGVSPALVEAMGLVL